MRRLWQYVPFRSKGVPQCELLKCEGCRLAKAHLLPTETEASEVRPEKDRALKKDNLRPGSMVSTDQYVSSVKGRLPHTAGKEKGKECYSGGTVYVDDASGFIFVQNQVSLKADKTLRGKHSFEKFA